MPILNANTQVFLGPYKYGASIIFRKPKSDSNEGCPTLDNTTIFLKTVPKTLTLTSGSKHILKAGTMPVTYDIVVSDENV